MSSIENINNDNQNDINKNNDNKDEGDTIVFTSTEAFSACLDKIFSLNHDPMIGIVNLLYNRNFKSAPDIFKWLLFYHKDKSDYIILLALFYHFNIGNDGTKENEFELFQTAAASKNPFAEYFVGKCFEEGWGNTKKKSSKAVIWFKKSKDECLAARYSLAAYYYRKQKFYLAIMELEKAVEKGNVKALHLLGLCFQKGRGTNINVSKGFELFMRSAEEGLPEAQCELGRCYEFGTGTTKDLSKALEWFKKSTSNGVDCSADLGRVRAKIMKQI
ncbi:18496_t:CDS:2 [Dentiscutata erythropus]|uniref:18496_t:CDS:1 n=1 Tax=Dentiscutata erythropus TaxID=1348616 RepID=A0A9N9ALE6_9GLOM|nr:18496_t:CDS:2 [Dentiscutata erythropus]